MALSLELDMDLFTLGEFADLCDAAGIDPEKAAAGDMTVGMQMLPALYWVLKRRTQPDLTLEGARGAGASVLQELPDLLAAASKASRLDPTEPKKSSPRKRPSAASTPATRSRRSAT